MIKNYSTASQIFTLSNKYLYRSNLSILEILSISLSIVILSFIWESNKEFNLADEGFLLYGAQRVIAGEVPIRDFAAYDPARYYWVAFFMNLYGSSGIIAMRLASSIFQTIGLFIGSYLLASNCKKISSIYLAISSVTLFTWMSPYFKAYDYMLAISWIGVLTFFIKKPTKFCYFSVGIYTGLVALWGRNHALYGIIAFLLILFYLKFENRLTQSIKTGLAAWCIGLIIGITPYMLACISDPDFYEKIKASIDFYFEIKGTNLSLPIPLPWDTLIEGLSTIDIAQQLLLRTFFLILPFLTTGLVIFMIKKSGYLARSPAFIAATLVSIPYLHYCYSRADTQHLALGILPSIIACAMYLSYKKYTVKWLGLIILFLSSLIVSLPLHTGWQFYRNEKTTAINILGDQIQLESGRANVIKTLQKITSIAKKNGDSVFFAPHYPGIYASLKMKFPTYDIYPITPRNIEFEKREIELLKKNSIGFAFIVDTPLDDKEELRFSRTHPLTFQYFIDNFDLIEKSPTRDILLFRKRLTAEHTQPASAITAPY